MSKSREERSSRDSASSPPTRAEVLLDDHAAAAIYANLCRVSSTPEEVVIDLAFDASPLATGARRVAVNQRVILSHFAAKRLAVLLSATVQHHERAFGVLETDYRKRVKSAADHG